MAHNPYQLEVDQDVYLDPHKLVLPSHCMRSATGKVVVTICEGSKTVLNCTNGRINIGSALYGRTEADVCPHDKVSNTNCMAAGVFDTISCCTGLSQCAVTASSSLFGDDPCPGTYKYLQITYTCEPEDDLPPQTLISIDICEGKDEPRITCSAGQTISICSSIYGQSDTTTCAKTRPATTSNVDCMSLNPLYVRTTCQGEQSCTVNAVNSVLGGDPCRGTYKYLHIDYRCVA
ncbi:L-rhamnose-binding lectin CSL3-like [Strongylocentrotus purpuratus]|uniref:SUEL-type lectin domain-containing protein n=1 Tax=Strongylocentrotus purpuratus TaxID=7668 RepID=A0A7M7HMJ5_STRPU|nr:L-rhamnose-binding lectin CSL3-like [Strongylocentrotus purpuratus]